VLVKTGVVFPQTEIGADPGAVRAYAQRVEELGFSHVLAYDIRAGRLADGWFPMMRPGPKLDEARAMVTEAAVEAGRDPAALGMEGRVSWREGADGVASAVAQWREAGATHVSINTMGAGLASVDDHLAALAETAGALNLNRG
jgi:hypothetical protein